MYQKENQLSRDELKDPYWLDDQALGNGSVEFLGMEEITFWQEFIAKYLKPLVKDKVKEKEMEKELLQLRNRVCLFFLLINSIFVILIFTLQSVTRRVHSMTYLLPCADEDGLDKGQAIEPISVAFTIIFGVLLVTQFICMLFHRLGTLLHILSSTQLFRIKSTQLRGPDASQDSLINEGMELIRGLQKFTDDDSVSVVSAFSDASFDDLDDQMVQERHRPGTSLWNKISKQKIRDGKNTLSKNFERNFGKLTKSLKEINNTLEIRNGDIENDVGGIEEHEESDVPSPLKRLRLTTFKMMSNKSFQAVVNLATDQQRSQEVIEREKRVARARNNWDKVIIHIPRLPAVSENNAVADQTQNKHRSTFVDVADMLMKSQQAPNENECLEDTGGAAIIHTDIYNNTGEDTTN